MYTYISYVDAFLYVRRLGKMLEWLKRHAWKACIPLKGIGGSNPSLSANRLQKDFTKVVNLAFKI